MSRDDDGADAVDTLSTAATIAIVALGALFLLLPLLWLTAEMYALFNRRPKGGFRSDPGGIPLSKYYRWEAGVRATWSLRMVLGVWAIALLQIPTSSFHEVFKSYKNTETWDFLFALGSSVLPFALLAMLLGVLGHQVVSTWIVKSYEPSMDDFWRDPNEVGGKRIPQRRGWGWAISGYTSALLLTLAFAHSFDLSLDVPTGTKGISTGRGGTPSCKGIIRRIRYVKRMHQKDPRKWARWVKHWKAESEKANCE